MSDLHFLCLSLCSWFPFVLPQLHSILSIHQYRKFCKTGTTEVSLHCWPIFFFFKIWLCKTCLEGWQGDPKGIYFNKEPKHHWWKEVTRTDCWGAKVWPKNIGLCPSVGANFHSAQFLSLWASSSPKPPPVIWDNKKIFFVGLWSITTIWF